MELLAAGDPRLAPSADPARSRARIEGADPADAVTRARMLELLELHGAELADRSCSPGHLTGSALVVDPSGPRILLILHAKLRRWLQPGGHADGDHELAGVALREATEETGIEGLSVLVPAVDLDIHEVDHGDALGDHLHLDVRFVVVAPPGARVAPNHESLEVAWVTPEELSALADEAGLVRLAEAGLGALERSGRS